MKEPAKRIKMPILKKFKPMIADNIDVQSRDNVIRSNNYLFEIKYDGIRAMMYYDNNDVNLVNIKGNDIGSRFPEFDKLKFECRNAVFDGVIVSFDKNNNLNNSYLEQRYHLSSEKDINEKSNSMPVVFIVFDVLFLNDHDITNKPLSFRKNILDRVIIENKLMKKPVTSTNGFLLCETSKETNNTGIIAKKLDSVYSENKKSDDWLYIDNFKTMDVIVFFYTSLKGSKGNKFSSLGCGVIKDKKLNLIGSVGNGIDEQILKVIKDNYFKDEFVLDNKKNNSKPLLEFNLKKYNLVLKDPGVFFKNSFYKEQIVFVKPFVIKVRYLNFEKDSFTIINPSLIKIKSEKKIDECVFEG